MFREKLAVIIPTKDRLTELNRLLGSIAAQGVEPVQIIIVDGGLAPAEKIAALFSDHFRIDYIRKTPASLTVQRNLGIRMLCEEATLAAFLDDDIVLERGSLENMLRFWEAAPVDTGGAAFNNMSDCYKRPTLAQRFFLVNSNTPGRILRSGFQSKLCSLDKTTAVEWLVGCAMAFRRKVFDEFTFDERFSGYARYEDVDFSYRVGKKYRLYVVSDAKVEHLNKAEDVSFSFSLGRMEVINRIYFVRKNPTLSLGSCYWALFGIFLNNVLRGIFFLNKRYMLRAVGNLAGILNIRESHISKID